MALVAGAGLLFGSPSPALAHYVYVEPKIFEGWGVCVYVWSEVSHGSGGGYAKSRDERTDIYCGVQGLNVGAGRVGAGFNYMVWNQNTGRWVYCTSIGILYNTAPDYDKVTAWNFGSIPPCGDSYYGTNATSSTWIFTNSSGQPFYWNDLAGPWSGYHWIGSTPDPK